MNRSSSPKTTLSMRRIFQTWWPLAAGWLLMMVEIPILTAVIARNSQPEINLAAWGVIFAITTILGAPALMFLAVSTALSKDWAGYLTLRRYVVGVLAVITLLHALIAFTPLYDLIVVQIISVPPEIIAPARLGVIIMLPWAAAVGYRRFNYGVLIRLNQARAVTVGVLTRLASDVVLLALLFWWGNFSGMVIATTTFIMGIMVEAIYSWLRLRPVLQHQLKHVPPQAELLTLPLFLNFFIPLALTSILQVLAQPLVSAGLSRMPNPLESLAVWPVVFGLLMIFSSAGMSYTEVVVVLLDEPQALPQLRRFALWLGSATVGLLLLIAVTPLAQLWFEYVAALPVKLVLLATWGLWIALPIPGLRVLESWYQGILINSKRTYGITESVIVFVIVSGVILWGGVTWGIFTGLYLGLTAIVLGDLVRTAWLRYRTGMSLQAVKTREASLRAEI